MRRALLTVGMILAIGIAVVLTPWGRGIYCGFSVDFRTVGVPDVEGLTLEEARDRMGSCVDLAVEGPDDDAAIVVQQGPGKYMNTSTPVLVWTSEAPKPPDSSGE